MEEQKYKIDPEEHAMRQDIEKERRGFWEKIISLSSVIFGAIVALSSEPKTGIYSAGLKLLVYNIIIGMFLIFIDNRRRRFYLDFASFITNLMERSKDFYESIRLYEIEKNYGFGYDKEKDVQIINYLKRDGWYKSRFARILYKWGMPFLEFFLYLTFVIALLIIAKVVSGAYVTNRFNF